MQNGVYSYSSTAYTARAFSIADNAIKESGLPVSYCDSIVSKNEIDFSAYTTVTVKNDWQDLVLDVSGYNGSGYLFVDFLRSGNTMYQHVGVSSQKEDFGKQVNVIDNLLAYNQPTTNALTITEITIE